MKTVMLYSGGADSLALWYMAHKPVGVYVCIGSKYESKELQAITSQQNVLPELQVAIANGPSIGYLEQKGGRIPYRNASIILAAAAATQASRIIVGFLRGEASPDKSRKFITSLSQTMSASEGRRIEVIAPAMRMTKTELLRWLRDYHPNAPLHLTVSCYAASGEPCGNCQSCFRADVAKYLTGWSDRVPTLPTERASAIRSALDAGVTRWPDLLRNNLDAWKALRGKGKR